MKDKDFFYPLLKLISVKQLGPRRIRRLVNYAGNPADVFGLSLQKIVKIPGFSRQLVELFRKQPDSRFALEQLELCQQRGIQMTHLWAEDYPSLLKQIPDPPPLLWYRGNLKNLTENTLVIVGTRRPTAYGRKMTETISRELVGKNIAIISGLARGIDSIAHFNAIKFGGSTYGVMASGADIIYPPENKDLAEEIVSSGAILSEFPVGTKPEPSFFYRRNRIISGLGKGVIVIEAGQKSGSLITAAFGIEQNRELFAVPGQATSPQSQGCLRLIQEGAKLVLNTEDILSEFPAFNATIKSQPTLSLLTEKEALVYEAISDNPVHIDTLAETTGFSLNALNSILLNLELEGYVTQLSGKMFIRA